MKELREYIEALKAIREMTDTLPYNVPEMLEDIVKQMDNSDQELLRIREFATHG